MSTQSIAVSRAIALLNAAQAQYKIITEDGAEYGGLTVVIPKEKKRIHTRPRGELRDYYLPHIQNMKSGDLVKVPAGPYELEDLRGPITSYCSQHWGNGSYVTSLNRAENAVEVLRVE